MGSGGAAPADSPSQWACIPHNKCLEFQTKYSQLPIRNKRIIHQGPFPSSLIASHEAEQFQSLLLAIFRYSLSRNLPEQIKGLFWHQRWIFHSYVRNFSFHPVQAVIANQFLHSFLSSLSDVLVVVLGRLCVWPLQESNSVILTRRHQMDGQGKYLKRNALSLTNPFNDAEHYNRPSWMGRSSRRKVVVMDFTQK